MTNWVFLEAPFNYRNHLIIKITVQTFFITQSQTLIPEDMLYQIICRQGD